LEIAHMLATSFHKEFEAFLPKIKEAARFAFRGLNSTDRAEAVADLTAANWAAWCGLLSRGKNPVVVGPSGILGFALRYVRNGRRVGNLGSGRGRMDLFSRRTQKAIGFRLISLASAQQEGELKSWVANDRRSSPADSAAFLLDFEEWLGRLPERRRLSAELLAQGHRTGEVAKLLRVTAGAISQTRVELAKSWEAFQHDQSE
jgi:hypothetical protein